MKDKSHDFFIYIYIYIYIYKEVVTFIFHVSTHNCGCRVIVCSATRIPP